MSDNSVDTAHSIFVGNLTWHGRHREVLLKDRKSTRLSSSHSSTSYAVFCLKKKKAALADNVLLNAGMFVWRGDDTIRHNLPYRPVFDPLVGVFFCLGVDLSLLKLLGLCTAR